MHGRRRLRRRGIVAISLFSLLAVVLVHHMQAAMGDGGHRSAAEEITRALLERDLHPVISIFPSSAASELADDVRLGALADRLNGLGALRGVRFVGQGPSPDTQRFTATFTRGSVDEEVAFEGDRVIGFTVLPALSK